MSASRRRVARGAMGGEGCASTSSSVMWFVSLARQNKRSRYLPSYSQTDQVPALPSRCKYQTTVTPEARDGWRPRGVRGPSKQSCTNEKRRRKRIFFRRSKSRFLIWGPPQAKKSWVRAAYRERWFVPRCILPSAPPPAQRWEPLYSFPLFPFRFQHFYD